MTDVLPGCSLKSRRNITAEFYSRHYIRETESGCWEWTGPYHSNGPRVRFGGTGPRSARRFVWEHLRGGCPIPERQKIFDTCGNRRCVNPDHMSALMPWRPKPWLSWGVEKSIERHIHRNGDGCMEWGAAMDGNWPILKRRMAGTESGRIALSVRRYVWEQAYGPIPEQVLVARACPHGNARCVSLAHCVLFVRSGDQEAGPVPARERALYQNAMAVAEHVALFRGATLPEMATAFGLQRRPEAVAAAIAMAVRRGLITSRLGFDSPLYYPGPAGKDGA